ncbi:hypothetical protein SAMN05421767_1273 [Granulicatella balaenopterae]|uniref:Membrane protein YdfK n=1 Tax=Granulicatella balaenopterae TaxID=137733 RepID=A0A1H9MGN2_9LACT|nr:DUF554 domain-containing protein [Granulicatella balaenopterae]SER22876.1 hypothetical protein SAMN05421767_1273 [Granulicatella balaenopterae]
MGTIINALTILISGLIGLAVHKGLSQRFIDTIMKAIALAVFGIALQQVARDTNPMVLILSLVLGSIIGEACQIDLRIAQFAGYVQAKFASHGQNEHNIAEGFISATMLLCIGAMSIIGSIQSGLSGDNSMLYTKSIIDAISTFILAASQGPGVLLAAGSVLIYQGTLTIAAHFLSPFLGPTIIASMSSVGGILLIALSLNILEVTKLKLMNFIPAIFMPILLMPLLALL